MQNERTRFIRERFDQLMPGRDDAWPEVYDHSRDIIQSHSSLLHTSRGNPEDPTGTRESCYAIAEEAVRRYRFMRGLDEPKK